MKLRSTSLLSHASNSFCNRQEGECLTSYFWHKKKIGIRNNGRPLSARGTVSNVLRFLCASYLGGISAALMALTTKLEALLQANRLR
jgi:hypothetical protein